MIKQGKTKKRKGIQVRNTGKGWEAETGNYRLDAYWNKK